MSNNIEIREKILLKHIALPKVKKILFFLIKPKRIYTFGLYLYRVTLWREKVTYI